MQTEIKYSLNVRLPDRAVAAEDVEADVAAVPGALTLCEEAGVLIAS